MSDIYYATRLRWCRHEGMAKLHGHCVPLVMPPDLGLPFEITGLDYVPETGLRRIQPYGEPWRDMGERETAAADQFLWDTASV